MLYIIKSLHLKGVLIWWLFLHQHCPPTNHHGTFKEMQCSPNCIPLGQNSTNGSSWYVEPFSNGIFLPILLGNSFWLSATFISTDILARCRRWISSYTSHPSTSNRCIRLWWSTKSQATFWTRSINKSYY